MTAFYCRSNGNDGNDGLSDANAVATPSVLDGLVNGASGPHVGYMNRGQTWTHTVFGSSLILYLTAAGTGTAEAQRTRIDAYGSGAKPILDKEWNNPGDYVYICQIDGDYQRFTNIEVRNVGPETSGSNNGGGAFKAGANGQCVSPEFYSCVANGAWRNGFQTEQWLGAAVTDSCEVTNVARDQTGSFGFWGGGIAFYRNMNDTGPPTATCSNNTVYQQYGEAISAFVAEGVTIENNWAWGNWAAQFYIQCARSCTARLNKAEGTTDTDFHRYTAAVGFGLGYDIESGNSTSRAQQADDGSVAFYLNLVSYCGSGIYWPAYGHADAGTPINIDFDHNTLVDNNTSFETYSPESGSTGCSVRCNISMPLTSSMTHDNGNGMHTDVTVDYNYWHNTIDATRHASLTGANDVIGSSLTLSKGSGWRSTDGDVVANDYRPQSDQGGTDLSYDRDYFNSDITMDEFGAIKYAAANAARVWLILR